MKRENVLDFDKPTPLAAAYMTAKLATVRCAALRTEGKPEMTV